MEYSMTIEKYIRLFAGIMIILSIILTVFISKNFLWLTGFIGMNLIQSSFTNFCPLSNILKKIGIKESSCHSS
jgi:hypothetical protein